MMDDITRIRIEQLKQRTGWSEEEIIKKAIHGLHYELVSGPDLHEHMERHGV